ncbi:hypothetical protein ACJ72_06449 [Emergomyces africanus]|uniref:D-xylulose reductase n=1 Tax=Emergomyces africanus TaxID=1955775 RepID=A0A1B7NQZ5_9EURO|nr:hypothetical protein ACJ72_06449 [Emergomyces africanus]
MATRSNPQRSSQLSPQLSHALVLHGAKDLRLEVRHTPPPPPGELQIAIRATGLCGSDLHYYHHGRNGDFVVRSPLCLGHESVGMVTATGVGVNNFEAGDRVALEVGLPCRKCSLCIQGRYNICRTLRFRSSAKTSPHLDGTLMELTSHPAGMCHMLPARISDVQGALIEPLAVCLHAIRRSNPPPATEVRGEETSALIFGAGAIGLLLTAALAATQRFDTLVPEAETAQLILSTFSVPDGFSRTYDCTGVASCVRTGIYATGPGGAVVQIGMGGESQPRIPLSAAALREIDLIGVFRYDGQGYPDAVALMASGKLDGVAELVVTHCVQLEDGVRAFELAGKGVDEQGKTVVKVVVVSGQEEKDIS